MKFTQSFLARLLLAVALIGLLAMTSAQAQVTPTRTGDAIAGPLLMSDATTNLTAAQQVRIPVKQGAGLAIVPVGVGLGSTNTGTSALCFSVATDSAGTNYSTTTPLIKTFTPNGTTAFRGFIPITPDELRGATGLLLRTITNAAVNVPGLRITNVLYSVPN